MKLRTFSLALLYIVLSLGLATQAMALLDDHVITINSPADVTTKRNALIQFIWGVNGFPAAKLPSSVTKNVASPVAGLNNLERVDQLDVTMDAGEKGLAYHFIPQRKNDRLVVVHHGHACTFDDSLALADQGYGMQRTINGLLSDGYSVLAVYMPHMKPNDCGTPSHDWMFANITTTGSVMKFFLEPVAACLNYLKTKSAADGFPVYHNFNMVGLSGGGWTTTVYAAIDPRIELSFPVAGSIPLYLRSDGSIGDSEQTLPSFYQIAGYPDLYVLGSYGPGRKQVQILNRHDDCCFGETQHSVQQTGMTWDQAMRKTESDVRLAQFNLGSNGFFRLEIDETSPAHMISHNAVVNVILSELNGGRRYVGASSSAEAFVRGMNGHLWHNGPAGWSDTGFPMVGAAAVLQGAVNGFDVFYRDPSNKLMHASFTGAGWTTQSTSGIIITDPAAVSWGAGRFDVVALGTDYKLYHWWWNGNAISSELVDNNARALGPPALVTGGVNQLHIFFRGWDRALYSFRSNGVAPWTLESIGGIMLDFPSAVAKTKNAVLRAYVRGQSGQLWEASQATIGGPWSWSSISAVTGTVATVTEGSPSASLACGDVLVHIRTASGSLGTFTLSGSWSFSNNGGVITGSPTSTPGGALARGQSAGLWLFDRVSWIQRSGIFD